MEGQHWAFSSTGWGHFLRERPSAAGSSELVGRTFLVQHHTASPNEPGVNSIMVLDPDER